MSYDTAAEVAEDLGCSRELVRLNVDSDKWFNKKQHKVVKKVSKVPAQRVKNIPVYEY